MTQAAPSAGRPHTGRSTPATLRGTAWRLGLVSVAAVCLGAVAGAAAAAPGAASLTGQITRIVDGDSVYFRVAPDAAPLELRLAGIDAPEGCQPGGAEARTALAGFVLGKTVTAMTAGHDAYGRTLARLSVGELEVNKRMVIEGQAWSIRTKWDRGPYVAQEKVAKALHRGVHASGEAELPALFRKRHGPCKSAPPEGEDAVANAAPGSDSAPMTMPPNAAPNATANFTTRSTVPARPTATTPGNTLVVAGSTVAAGLTCDGRKRCTQMRSCEEARWFLQRCPGVEMDGDRDGVPCEQQWCGKGR